MNDDIIEDLMVDHLPGEATPSNVSAPTLTPPTFGLQDKTWSDQQWRDLLHSLVASGFFSWEKVTALALGHLNPSQVGTSLASSKGFKRNYGKGNTMRIVMEWMYRQTGKCASCGSRLELQADHVQPREEFANSLDADTIENITFLCRRCNVIKRPSHEFGDAPTLQRKQP